MVLECNTFVTMNKHEFAEELGFDTSTYLKHVNKWRKDKSEGASYEIGIITGFFFYVAKSVCKRDFSHFHKGLTIYQIAEKHCLVFEDEAPFYDQTKITFLQTSFAACFIKGWIDGYFR